MQTLLQVSFKYILISLTSFVDTTNSRRTLCCKYFYPELQVYPRFFQYLITEECLSSS